MGSHLRDLHRKPKLQSILGFKGSRRILGDWKSEVLQKQKRGRVINKNSIIINKVNMSERSESLFGHVKGNEKKLQFSLVLWLERLKSESTSITEAR